MELIICCGTLFFLLVLGVWAVGLTYCPDHFKITYVPFLNNEAESFIFAVIVTLILIMGCITGYLLQPIVTSAFETSEEGWVLLEKPPQEIKSLRAANLHTVYAETADDGLISCYYESAYDNDCWHEISQLPEIREYGPCSGWNVNFPKAPSSIRVVDRIDIGNCVTFAGMESLDTSSYVLSDANQVYQNSYGGSLFSAPNLFWVECLFSIAGLIAGFLIVFGLMIVNVRYS